jgi:hypothetical protein
MVSVSVWESDGAISMAHPVTTKLAGEEYREGKENMRQNSGWLDLTRSRHLHEILFSLSIAFLGVSLLFIAVPGTGDPFSRLEVRINLFLHVRQTDFIRGYLACAIPSAILALCIVMMLQLSSGTRLTKELLRSVSGVMLLLGPPVFWFCYYQVVGWPFGWPYRWAPFELTVVVVCVALYLRDKWTFPAWVGVSLLLAHYVFWYWTPSTNPGLANYAGPIAPILGFCSALAWGMYVARVCNAPS